MSTLSGLWASLTLRQKATFAAHAFKAATKSYHREMIGLLRPYIPADAVVLDVGGHAGHFAQLFATLAPAGQIYTFEPSPYACSILELRRSLGRLPANISIVPQALSDRSGMLELRTPLKHSGSLGFGTAKFGLDAGVPSRIDSVPVTTIDLFAAAVPLDRIDFIKLDIEGWEHHALLGGSASLRRFRPAVLAEVSDRLLRLSSSSAAALWDFFSDQGYSAYRLDAPAAPLAAFAGDDDYLFLAD